MGSKQTSETNSSNNPANARRESLQVILPIVLLAVASFAIAWHFVQPAPPKHVIIATGSKTGAYYAFAKQYADYFAENGIDLEVKETGGSIDNYKLLTAPDSGVDLAIVQCGSSPPDARSKVEAIAGIYFEPVMVFFRGEDHVTQLSQLAGKKIAIGALGSGVRSMAISLLTEAGATDGDTAGTKWIDDGGDASADALAHGKIDAAFYVIAPTAPVIATLLAAPHVHLMSFDQSHAYGRRNTSLSPVTLYQGSVDIQRNLPETDVQLIAAPATLVMRPTTHQAVIELLVEAAQKVHSAGTLLSEPGTFPVPGRSELKQNKDAHYFLTNKPSILRRTFPFWLASMIDRLLIMLLPLLVVLIPLSRMIPPLMKWNTRRKILVWYQRIASIDKRISPQSSLEALQSARVEVIAIERELLKVKVPVSYMEELYTLRVHVSYVGSRIAALAQAAAPAS